MYSAGISKSSARAWAGSAVFKSQSPQVTNAKVGVLPESLFPKDDDNEEEDEEEDDEEDESME